MFLKPRPAISRFARDFRIMTQSTISGTKLQMAFFENLLRGQLRPFTLSSVYERHLLRSVAGAGDALRGKRGVELGHLEGVEL
jgi:hypothetical protein